ncbi:MAG TPA: SDR family oxidoreductase [Nitrososphaerales archaeon]|nr:SDR family oxidoreductase [Nitrososphaerales archaeon]
MVKVQEQASSPTSRETRGRLEGEVAIITGGSGGIGQATALTFANEGAKVALHFSGLTEASFKRATEVSDKLKALGYASISLQANVSKYEEVKALVDKVVSEWGKVSVIVCFAGFPSSLQFWSEDPLELSGEDLLSAIKVDFLGSYHFIRALKDRMKKDTYGKIVLVSSTPTFYGEELGYRFALAKDLNRLTVKSLAPKLIRQYGIYLNAIAPGPIGTHANRVNYTEQQWNELTSSIPLGKIGDAKDIANVALFLSSHDSDYVVGQTIIVDGREVRV